MSAARAVPLAARHIHLPSVHVRFEAGGGEGFDYEEDLYVRGRGQTERIERVVRLAVIRGGAESLVRETRDVLCDEEIEALEERLPVLMDEDSPRARDFMEQLARREFARQGRIAAGEERACAGCGCSESRACSGGCVWASAALCSRCV